MDIAAGNERALIAATLGFATIEILKMWRETAPSLKEVRANPNTIDFQQRFMDANYLCTGLAVLIGGTVAWMTKSWLPLLLSLGTLTYMAWWYRAVLNSDNSMMPRSDNGN